MPEKVALTIGKFDGLHRGHLLIIRRLLSLSKKYGLKSVVITLEKSGQQFLTPTEEKISLLKNMGVTEVKVIDFQKVKNWSAKKFWEYLKKFWKILYLVVGSDFAFGYRRQGDIRWLKRVTLEDGVSLVVVSPLYSGKEKISSQAIRNYLVKGNLEKANYLLGRNYSLSGKRVKGLKLATRLGVPTINIQVGKKKLLPEGVFAGKVLGNNFLLPALVYIGSSPTLNLKRSSLVEVHLLSKKVRKLPDKKITVELVRFHRPEKKFASLTKLCRAITQDLHWAKKLGGVK